MNREIRPGAMQSGFILLSIVRAFYEEELQKFLCWGVETDRSRILTDNKTAKWGSISKKINLPGFLKIALLKKEKRQIQSSFKREFLVIRDT